MLDVPDVELDPLVPRQARAAVDLRPARDAGLDLEPPSLARRVLPDLIGEGGAGADQAHVSADDVPELPELAPRAAAHRPAARRTSAHRPPDGVAGPPPRRADGAP